MQIKSRCSDAPAFYLQKGGVEMAAEDPNSELGILIGQELMIVKTAS